MESGSADDAPTFPNEDEQLDLPKTQTWNETLPGSSAPTHPEELIPVGEPLEDRGARIVFDNRFAVVKGLGAGGMGEVYHVVDLEIPGRQVALKRILPRFSEDQRFRDLFSEEIFAAQHFVSEQVVQVRDTGEMGDGRLYFTMDLVEGESLQKLLKQQKSLLTRHALEITHQVLAGLACGHENGYIHRDIKPSNVMLVARVPKTADNPDGVAVRLLDFGLAKLVEDASTGTAAGTPYYMSPEQAQGQPLDHRTDLFSVGVVLFEMLAGHRPFEGKTLAEIQTDLLESDVHALVAELDEVPKPVRRILLRALEKDREKRFPSATEFQSAIAKNRLYRPAERPTVLSAAIGGLLLFAGAEGAYIWYQETRTDAAGTAVDTAQLQSSELHQRILSLILEHQREVERLNEELAQTRGDLQSKNTELAGINGLLNQSRGSVTDLEYERTEMQRSIEENDRRTLAGIRDRESLLQQITTLKQSLNNLNYQIRPAVMSARHFDEIIELIGLGRADSAARILDDEQKRVASTLLEGRGTGASFVAPLVRAASSLQQYIRSDRLDRGSLVGAQTDIRSSRLAFEEFPVLASEWLPLLPEEGVEAPDRLGVASAVLEQLETSIGEEMAAIETMHEEEFRRLIEADDTSPAAAIAHATTYSCSHVENFLERYAVTLPERLEPGGRLALQALFDESGLDPWAEYLLKLEQPSKLATRILEYWYAKLWYGAGELPEDHEAAPMPLPSLPTGTPRADWRASMALQQAFARSKDEAEVEECPLITASRLLFRDDAAGSSEPVWWLATVKAEDSGWAIEKRTLYEDVRRTGSRVTMHVTRDGHRYENVGLVLLDLLACGESVEVVGWSALPAVEDLPAQSWAPAPHEYEPFHRELLESPLPCLVIREGDVKRLFSPKIGLVAEYGPGDGKLELVFARGWKR